MNDQTFSMLGIEEELKKDSHGMYAMNIQDRLYQYLAQIHTVLDSGLTPDEFAITNRIYRAIQESIKVVMLTREGLHRLN